MSVLPRIAAASMLLLVPVLSGCSADETYEVVDGCIQVEAGTASDSINVDGEFGGKVTIDFEPPVDVKRAERSVLIEGEGELPEQGTSVRALESIYSGKTGEVVGAQVFELATSDDTLPTGIRAGIDCLTVGTRSVTVIPAVDLYSAEQLTQLALSEDESIILVTDIIEAVETPVAADWTENVATVTWDGDQPSIELPEAGAPTELSLAVLEGGTGDMISATSTVKVNYMGVSWTTGEVFDQSYDGDPIDLAMTGVIEGFSAALVGQKIGAQVLVSIPAALAYGTDPTAHNLGGQDLLFLIDAIELVKP